MKIASFYSLSLFLGKIGLVLSLLLCLSSCKKDPCKDITCQNGGTCNDTGLCECAAGYEGTMCEVAIAKRFVGNYHAMYDCVSADNTVAIEMQPGTNPLALTVRNLGDYLCPDGDYLIMAAISHDTLFLQNQPVCITTSTPSGYTFSGFAKLKGDSLKMTYTVVYSGNTDNCHATLVKN